MNKLRKPPSKSPFPQMFATFQNASMTMQYATIPPSTTRTFSAPPPPPPGPSDSPQSSSSSSRSAVRTLGSEEHILAAADQRWVTRALRAEALLAAHAVHREEVKTLGHHQEATRQRELSLVAKEYKEKHQALERLLIFLLILIAVLVILIAYLATYYIHHSTPLQQKHLPRSWSAVGRPSHFTIPILSPFTSVVEHESSIISTKSLATLAAISACLIYLIFRYWFSSRGTTRFTAASIASSARNAIMSTASSTIDR